MKYDVEKLEFRPLLAEEIELRIGTVSPKGVSLLLYQDSRCAMNILDETVGKTNWQRDHKEIKGNLYGGIGIWDAEKCQWIWKWDCGTESNTEKEKGESSDSMKRSAVNWGIARELYTAPFIFVKCETKKKETGRGYELKDAYQFSGARVSHISYNATREISELIIEDSNGEVIYQYPKGRPKNSSKREITPSDMITAEDSAWLKEMLEKTESDVEKFLAYVSKYCGEAVSSVDGMTYPQFEIAKKAISAKLNSGKEN